MSVEDIAMSVSRFRCIEPGEWVATVDGEDWTLERRRAEPGSPAGWYLFGPWGDPFGEYMGRRLLDAADAAEQAIVRA